MNAPKREFYIFKALYPGCFLIQYRHYNINDKIVYADIAVSNSDLYAERHTHILNIWDHQMDILGYFVEEADDSIDVIEVQKADIGTTTKWVASFDDAEKAIEYAADKNYHLMYDAYYRENIASHQ